MPLQIVHYNNPILRKKGAKVTVFDAALAEFAAQMIERMHEAEGIGLAAQQVGRDRAGVRRALVGIDCLCGG